VTVAQLRKALDDLSNVPESAIVDASKLVEQFAKDNGRPITIRGRRYPLTAVTKYTRREQRAVDATVFGTPTGFWVWQTSGTRGDYQIPKRASSRPRYLFASGFDHPVRAPIRRHRGITGRGAWRKVRARAEQEVPQVFIDAVHDAVKAVQ